MFVAHAGLFYCFHNPPISDMDYIVYMYTEDLGEDLSKRGLFFLSKLWAFFCCAQTCHVKMRC